MEVNTKAKLFQEVSDHASECIANQKFSINELFQWVAGRLNEILDCEVAFINRSLRIMARRGFHDCPSRLDVEFESEDPASCLTTATPILRRQLHRLQPTVTSGKFMRILHFCFPLAAYGARPKYVMAIKLPVDPPHGSTMARDFKDFTNLLNSKLFTFELGNRQDKLYLYLISVFQNIIKAVSPHIHQHCLRVSDYVRTISNVICMKEAQVQKLMDIALVHDIGMISVPRSIFNKPGGLTNPEYCVIKKQVEEAYCMLMKMDDTVIKRISSDDIHEYEHIAKIILAHMEKFDGSGYPRGLAGHKIPLESRILAIANAYDAMTSVRVYQKPLSAKAAIEELKRCSGLSFDAKLTRSDQPCNHYDPEIVKKYVTHLENMDLF